MMNLPSPSQKQWPLGVSQDLGDKQKKTMEVLEDPRISMLIHPILPMLFFTHVWFFFFISLFLNNCYRLHEFSFIKCLDELRDVYKLSLISISKICETISISRNNNITIFIRDKQQFIHNFKKLIGPLKSYWNYNFSTL